MAQKITLCAYSIRLKSFGTRGNAKFKNLSDFDFGNDLLKIIKNGLDKLDVRQSLGLYHHNNEDKVMRVSRLAPVGRQLAGMIESGNYGTENIFINIKDGSKAGVVGKDQSLVKEFYFRFKIPVNSTLGLLIVENISGMGILTILTEYIRKYMKGLGFSNLTLEINPIAVDAIVDEWINQGEANAIKLIGIDSNKLSVGKMIGINCDESDVKKTLSFSIKDDTGLNLKKFLGKHRNKSTRKKGYVLEDGTTCDDIHIEVNHNGTKRTFSMNNIGSLGTRLEINPKLDDKGMPTYASLDNEADSYEDMFAEILDVNRI